MFQQALRRAREGVRCQAAREGDSETHAGCCRALLAGGSQEARTISASNSVFACSSKGGGAASSANSPELALPSLSGGDAAKVPKLALPGRSSDASPAPLRGEGAPAPCIAEHSRAVALERLWVSKE